MSLDGTRHAQCCVVSDEFGRKATWNSVLYLLSALPYVLQHTSFTLFLRIGVITENLCLLHHGGRRLLCQWQRAHSDLPHLLVVLSSSDSCQPSTSTATASTSTTATSNPTTTSCSVLSSRCLSICRPPWLGSGRHPVTFDSPFRTGCSTHCCHCRRVGILSCPVTENGRRRVRSQTRLPTIQ